MALIPAVFAFLMHLGRELIKDMEDGSQEEVSLEDVMRIGFSVAQYEIRNKTNSFEE